MTEMSDLCYLQKPRVVLKPGPIMLQTNTLLTDLCRLGLVDC